MQGLLGAAQGLHSGVYRHRDFSVAVCKGVITGNRKLNREEEGKEWSLLLKQPLGQMDRVWVLVVWGTGTETDGRILGNLWNGSTEITVSRSSWPGVVKKMQEALLFVLRRFKNTWTVGHSFLGTYSDHSTISRGNDKTSPSCFEDSNIKEREQEQWRKRKQFLGILVDGLLCETPFEGFQKYLASIFGDVCVCVCKLITQNLYTSPWSYIYEKSLVRAGAIWSLSLQ